VLYSVETAPLEAIANQTEFVTVPGGSRGLKAEYFSMTNCRLNQLLSALTRE